jgi:hypothetical protein
MVVQMAEEIRILLGSNLNVTSPFLRPPKLALKLAILKLKLSGLASSKVQDFIDFDNVKRWFDAIAEQFVQHEYDLKNIYNMDESGFAVGESQSSRALTNIREGSDWMVISGRQEWETAI